MYLAFKIIHLKCGVYFIFKYAGPQIHCKIMQKMSTTLIPAASGVGQRSCLLTSQQGRREGVLWSSRLNTTLW